MPKVICFYYLLISATKGKITQPSSEDDGSITQPSPVDDGSITQSSPGDDGSITQPSLVYDGTTLLVQHLQSTLINKLHPEGHTTSKSYVHLSINICSYITDIKQ